MGQQLNKYDTIVIPIDYNNSFLNCTKQEIQNYYTWFLNIKEQRLINPSNFLFDNQKDCLSEKKLKVVEMFLLNSVSTLHKPTDQYNGEMENIPLKLKPFSKPDEYVFDKKTISVCYDIGIFMGELIISLDNKIFWKLETDDAFADYGQPVLAKKKNKLQLNPFRVVKNAAAKIYEGTYEEEQLVNFFKTWKKLCKVDND